MKYIIIDKDKGFALRGHLVKGEKMVISERELMLHTDKSFEERLAEVEGEAYSLTEMNQIKSEGGWSYGL